MIAEAPVLTLPSHIGDWARENHALVQQVNARMAQKGPLVEEIIWGMVAEGCSPDWKTAKKKLQKAEEAYKSWTNDDNVPLGLIGLGLDGGEMDKLQGHYNVALAHFTTIEETLRNEHGPKALMEAVRKRMRTIADAEHSSKLAERANRKFMRMTEEMKNTATKRKGMFLGEEFGVNSRRKPLLSPWEVLQGGMKQLLAKYEMPKPSAKVEVTTDVAVAEAPTEKPQTPFSRNALRRYLNNNMN